MDTRPKDSTPKQADLPRGQVEGRGEKQGDAKTRTKQAEDVEAGKHARGTQPRQGMGHLKLISAATTVEAVL